MHEHEHECQHEITRPNKHVPTSFPSRESPRFQAPSETAFPSFSFQREEQSTGEGLPGPLTMTSTSCPNSSPGWLPLTQVLPLPYNACPRKPPLTPSFLSLFLPQHPLHPLSWPQLPACNCCLLHSPFSCKLGGGRDCVPSSYLPLSSKYNTASGTEQVLKE